MNNINDLTQTESDKKVVGCLCFLHLDTQSAAATSHAAVGLLKDGITIRKTIAWEHIFNSYLHREA